MLALPDAARCRSMRAPPRADDMRARSRRAIGLSEVQDGWEAPGGYAAPACAALSPSIAGRVCARSAMDWPDERGLVLCILEKDPHFIRPRARSIFFSAATRMHISPPKNNLIAALQFYTHKVKLLSW